MKKSAEILGLPIISITEGRELGMSKTLVIDAKNGLVAAITVEDEEWYRGVKLIPYASIIAIGDDAITILHSDNILTLGKIGNYEPLLVENIKILDTKAITKTGKILGKVSEIIVGDDGKIEQCEIRANDGALTEVSADKISIFSRQVTVIDMAGVKKIPAVKPAEEIQPVAEIVKPAEEIQPVTEIVKPVEDIPPVAEIVKPVEDIPPVEETVKPAEEIPPVAEIVKPAEDIQPVTEIVTPAEDIQPVTETVKPVEDIPPVAETVTPAEDIQPVTEVVKPAEDIPPVADIPTEENETDDFEEEEVEMPDMSDFEPEPEPEPLPPPEPARGIQQAEVLKAALRRVTENQQKNANPASKTETRKGGKTVTLVGRKAAKTITAANGKVIIEAGEEITDEVLQKARAANKFIELSMNSVA